MVGGRGSSSSSSSSRLSPSAPPFIINRSTHPLNRNPTNPSSPSVLGESFSSFGLESDDSFIGPFPKDHPLQTIYHLSPEFHCKTPLSVHNQSDFTALSTSTDIPLTDYRRDSSGLLEGLSYGDDRRSFSCKDNNGGVSLPNESLLKQGVLAAEGSQVFLSSASLCTKGSGVLGREHQIGFRGMEQPGADSSSSPVEISNVATLKMPSTLCSTLIPQEVPKLPYPAPVATPQVNGSIGGVMAFPVSSPVLSEDLNFSDGFAVNNNDNSFAYTTFRLKGPDFVWNSEGKEFNQDGSLIDTEKEIKDHLFVESSLTKEVQDSNKKDPLFIKESELFVSHPQNHLTEVPRCPERCVSIESSSEALDNNSEVDSPCWKGTQARRSPFEDSRPVNSELLKHEVEAGKTLNPLAPQFFPRKVKESSDYHGIECCQKSTSLDAVEAGPCPSKVISEVGALCLDEIYASKKEPALNNSKTSPDIISSQMAIPNVMEDYFRSLTGDNTHGSVTGVKGAAPTGSFSGAVWDNYHPSSTIDIQIAVNALYKLSEFLVHNCSSDSNSLKEQDQNILRHVINNLYFCMRKRGGQRSSSVETTPYAGTSNFEGSDVMHYVQKTESESVPHGFDKSQVIEKVPKMKHQIEEDMQPQVLLYKKLWLKAEAEMLMKYKDSLVRMKRR